MVDLKKLLKYSKEDSLIRDSAILFFSTLGLNLAGFFFHFFMGRVLGPAEYGILGAIFSLLYIILVPFNVVQTSITNFVASFKAKNQIDKINILLRRSMKRLFFIGLIVFILFFAFSSIIANFLNIPVKPLRFLSPIIIFALMLPVLRGIMQGMERFKALGINMTIEGIAKIGFGILFVVLGFGVAGAVSALVVSYLVPFVIALFVLIVYLKKKNESFDSKEIYSYAIPVMISLVLFTGLYTIDTLLVKKFFSESEAGLYIALSYIGRIIFFGTQSIALVMFPKSVANFSLNKQNNKLLKKALFLVTLLGGFAVLIYSLFPKLIINILYGKNYLAIANMTGLFGLIMLFLSLSYVLVYYNLSINRKRFVYILGLFLLIEVVTIYLYHSSLMQVVLILLGLSISMFIALIIYTFKNEKTINNNSSV